MPTKKPIKPASQETNNNIDINTIKDYKEFESYIKKNVGEASQEVIQLFFNTINN
jgi:hypothetical protein